MPSATAMPYVQRRRLGFIFQHASVGGREGVELAARTDGRLQLTLHLYPPKGQVLVAVEKMPQQSAV